MHAAPSSYKNMASLLSTTPWTGGRRGMNCATPNTSFKKRLQSMIGLHRGAFATTTRRHRARSHRARCANMAATALSIPTYTLHAQRRRAVAAVTGAHAHGAVDTAVAERSRSHRAQRRAATEPTITAVAAVPRTPFTVLFKNLVAGAGRVHPLSPERRLKLKELLG